MGVCLTALIGNNIWHNETAAFSFCFQQKTKATPTHNLFGQNIEHLWRYFQVFIYNAKQPSIRQLLITFT